MDANELTLRCTDSFGLYGLIWGVVLPLFVAYLAAAAYAFHRRRGDLASALEGLDLMQEITMLALDRSAGEEVDLKEVQALAQRLIRRFRLEALHRPKEVQDNLVEIVKEFLVNAHVADGREVATRNEIINRMNSAEENLVHMLGQLTIIESLKQGWANPGVSVSFNQLMQSFSPSKRQE